MTIKSSKGEITISTQTLPRYTRVVEQEEDELIFTDTANEFLERMGKSQFAQFLRKALDAGDTVLQIKRTSVMPNEAQRLADTLFKFTRYLSDNNIASIDNKETYIYIGKALTQDGRKKYVE